MSRHRLAAATLALAMPLVLLTGCTSNDSPTEPGSVLRPAGAQTFTLAVGQEVSLGGSSTLRLDRVTADSRCPTGVTCVWEGEVSLEIVIRTPTATLRITLTTRRPIFTALGYTLNLKSVAPYPEAGKEIPQGDYRVTLEVAPE